VNNELTATGDEGIFYNEEQKLELINNAKVWQGNNTITAHTVIAFLVLEILEGYGREETERAVMTVYSKGDTLNKDLEPEAPKEGDAPEEGSSPIVIVSDELKLENLAQRATFTGDVIATQDLTEITSDEMIVYITNTEETGDDIDKIEVFGNVRIQKETTTVTGETGLYRNKEQHAVVEGTEKKKARVVDTVQNLVLEAPVIEIFLATNTVKARGAESEIGGSRIRSEFGTDGNTPLFESPQATPTPEKKTDQNRPSVIVYPATTQ
jgi:lipopolysaccharide export system protein LptA